MPLGLWRDVEWRLQWAEDVVRWAMHHRFTLAMTIRRPVREATADTLARLGLVAPETGIIRPAKGLLEVRNE
jgi:hypothetical protein